MISLKSLLWIFDFLGFFPDKVFLLQKLIGESVCQTKAQRWMDFLILPWTLREVTEQDLI